MYRRAKYRKTVRRGVPRAVALLGLLAIIPLGQTLAASPAPGWKSWSGDVFAEAKAHNRLVILDLEAVWCHWCHVMADTTYGDKAVAQLLADHFLTIRADQDADPSLSARYGDWGWPATIIFAPDGTELAKLRGFVPPVRMAGLLKAFIADPTPGPSAEAIASLEPAAATLLSSSDRAALEASFAGSYDRKNGAWKGVNKFVDTDSMRYLLHLAEAGDADAVRKEQQTLDAARALIDPVWGGVFQYSDTADWRSPHYEKIMWYQASMLSHYAAAYALWHRPADLASARAIKDYLTRFLTDASGAFFTSQDADAGPDLTGKTFYARKAAERDALGLAPAIDRHIYARENGWAIAALVALSNATADADALARSIKSAEVMLSTRRRPDGGFNHGDADRGGPFLADNLAMGDALVALYGATGERKWLEAAGVTGRFVIVTFKEGSGGFKSAATSDAGVGPLSAPVRVPDEQTAAARFLNLLGQYTGDDAFHAAAEHALRYAAAPAIVASGLPLPGLLLADWELAREPAHVTILGHKDDTAAQGLHAAARALPIGYERIDWWDKREGALVNPDVTYPELEAAAAFVCTNRICSLPAFSAEELSEAVARVKHPSSG